MSQTFLYPSASANPSVGTNNTTAPTSSTEIGVIDNTGKLQGVSASNPLPTTSTISGTIDENLKQINGNTVNIGVGASSTGTQRVAVSSDSTLTSIGSITNALPAGSNTIGSIANTAFASTQSGTWDLNNISGTISLPTGASTSANQVTSNGYLSNIQTYTGDTSSYLANLSGPVSPGTASLNSLLSSGIYNSSPITATNGQQAALQIDVNGNLKTSLQTAIPAGANTIGSIANTSFGISGSLPAGTNLIGKVSIDQTTPGTTNGVQINAALPAGSNSIGTVGLNAGSNAIGSITNTSFAVTQATAASLNATVVGTGTFATQVTSLPSIPAGTNAIGSVTIGGTSKSNDPVYNVYSSTNITTAAYTQLIASTASTTNKIQIFDSSGQAMILATGGSGSETNQLYVPPGGADFTLTIPAGTRISYKALTANATTGYLIINLLG